MKKQQPKGSYTHSGHEKRVKITLQGIGKKRRLDLQLAFTLDYRLSPSSPTDEHVVAIWWKFPKMKTYRRLGLLTGTPHFSTPMVNAWFGVWSRGSKRIRLPVPFAQRTQQALMSLKQAVLES